MTLCGGSGFFLPPQVTPIPSKISQSFNKHILCQFFDTCKILFFNRFFKIEYERGPNFATEFEHMVKNCPNSIQKAGLEIALGKSRLDHKSAGNEGGFWFRNRKGSTGSFGLLFFVGQRLFLLRALTGDAYDQIEQPNQ